ncbi:MAG: AMP-binding protein, partial [Archangium sp.]
MNNNGQRRNKMTPRGDGFFQADCSVADLFDRSAERAPEARCIRSGSQSWTYAELRGRAAAVAGELAARGMGLETVVGVFLPRGAHLAAALLGTLKAGAAYLPIDITAPAARIEGLLRDANVRLVL